MSKYHEKPNVKNRQTFFFIFTFLVFLAQFAGVWRRPLDLGKWEGGDITQIYQPTHIHSEFSD